MKERCGERGETPCQGRRKHQNEINLVLTDKDKPVLHVEEWPKRWWEPEATQYSIVEYLILHPLCLVRSDPFLTELIYFILSFTIYIFMCNLGYSALDNFITRPKQYQ